jgi:phage terminase large subunit GpA-like protein
MLSTRLSAVSPTDLQKLAPLFARAATLTRPTARTTADEWARKNRVYKPSTDRPGPREPSLTPYVIDYVRAFDDPRNAMVVLACGSQMGKSEAILDVIGQRIDQRPVPTMYVGPDRNFVVDELEPRLVDMVDSSATLSRKIARGKKAKKTRKLIGGVQLRLAWAGSAAQLAGMSAGLVMVDEYDRMLANVKGEGDPLEMMKARGFAFRDRQRGVTSTPLIGLVDIERCPTSGLEFWKRMSPEDISSAIWKLWQSGTMYHFAWPCPCCSEYFVPRFKQLRGIDTTPSYARKNAFVECPRCGGVIDDEHKKSMNGRGVYVAPGQTVTPDGIVHGDPPDSSTASFWVSGLCSPFVTFGERAEAYVEASLSGDTNKLQGVVNTGFGEVYTPGGGEAPELAEINKAKQEHYKLGDLPAGTVHLTMGADVQGDRIYYAVRAWGARSTSWLVKRGHLEGATHGTCEMPYNDDRYVYLIQKALVCQ